MRRRVEIDDIKKGAKVYNDRGDLFTISEVKGDHVYFTEWSMYATVGGILDRFTVEEKPTGIPTFDGDIATHLGVEVGKEALPQGTKLDQGKLKPTLLLDDMALAIQEILKVLQFGTEKYSEGNWLKVPNGIDRYRNAADRHRLAVDELDDESGMMHLAHEATSILMLLELKLKEKRDAE